MTKRTMILAAAAMGLWLAGSATSQAATVTAGDPTIGGISYEWGVTMGQSDSAVISTGGVGAKSWAEPGNPVGLKGWTHTSDWVALDLSGLSESTVLTVTHERGATDSLFPAFSIYSGWQDTVSEPSRFKNIGNTSYFPAMTYLDHVANIGGTSGLDSGTGFTSRSKQYVLAPGLYSIALGGNPSFDLGQTGTLAFVATLATAPVPVPAAIWLFGSGLAGLVGLARRRMAA